MSRLAALFPALLLALPAAAIAGPAENKAVASRVILEKMGQGRFDIQPELYGPGFVAHGFGRDFTLAEDEASGRQLRAAFPDLKVKLDRIIAEGDLVSLHWSAVGTNTVAVSPFPGTGKQVAELVAVEVLRGEADAAAILGIAGEEVGDRRVQCRADSLGQ